MFQTLLTTTGSFFLVLLVGWILLFLHDLLTPGYKTWPEIARGNMAVGMASGGHIIGLAIIAWAAVSGGLSIWVSLVWLAIGGLLLTVSYWLFELLTPKLAVEDELAKDNRAVGLVSLAISVGSGLIISACI